MHEFGSTIEQFAEIAVSARHNASMNPEAYYQDPITIDDVHGRADDGRAVHQAALLPAKRRRRRHRAGQRGAGARSARRRPVWVLGPGEAISHTTMSEWDDFTESPCAARARSHSSGRA